MRQLLVTALILALVTIFCASAVIFGGLYNVSARYGHLPGVGWVLHHSFRNSVKLRAPAADDVPELTEDMAALGARHFDTGCRPCHGAPGIERTAAARAMVPIPPHIDDAVTRWTPAELFWLVREGVKMTGMPAFPAARDDEVWAIVAFLEQINALSGSDYARLTARKDGAEPVAYCVSCHGPDGRSDNPLVPRLDIQSEAYLLSALAAYREGHRASGIMMQAASLVSPAQSGALAAYFATRPAGETRRGQNETVLFSEGRLLAHKGSDDVPACAACHGPNATEQNDLFPPLAGQSATYLSTQLRIWRDGLGTMGPRSALMRHAAQGLTDADIAALAAYYSALAPDRDGS